MVAQTENNNAPAMFKSLYRAAAEVQRHEASVTAIYAERQAVVDAAIAEWEAKNPNKLEALRETEQALRGWTRVYDILKTRVSEMIDVDPQLLRHGGIQRGRARLHINDSLLQVFMRDQRNLDTLSLFMTVDRARMENVVLALSAFNPDTQKVELPSWISDRLNFMEIQHETIFDRDALAALYTPETEEGSHAEPIEPTEDPKGEREGKEAR